jgi:hypothetical protein
VLACVLAIAAVADATQRTITRIQAPAVAAAINLHHSDLPTLGQQRNPITNQEQKLSAQLTACIGGVPDSLALAEAQSPTFSTPGASALTISSTTEILPTATLVAKDLAAITGAKGVPCLKSQMRTQLGSSLAKGESLTVTAARLAGPVAGGDGTFELRFAITFAIKQGSVVVHVPVFYDVIGFAYGQAEVGLDLLRSATKPSSALEKKLAATLLKRARTAIG